MHDGTGPEKRIWKNISAFCQEDPDGADLKTTEEEKEVKDTDEDD